MITLTDEQRAHVERLVRALRRGSTIDPGSPLGAGSALDVSPTGTGKTLVASETLERLSMPSLVVCPLSVRPTWDRWLKVFGVENATVTHYERFRADPLPEDISERVLVFDEAQRVAGGRKTLQGKKAIKAICVARATLMLSATPATTPLDMEAIALATGLLRFPAGWWQWCKARGCVPNIHWGGYRYQESSGAMQRIARDLRAAGKLHRMSGDALPPEIRDVMTVPVANGAEIDEEHKRLKQLLDEGEDKRVAKETGARGGNMLTVSLRAREASESGMTGDIIELAENSSAPTAIFVCFRETLSKIEGALKCPVIHGDTPPATRQGIMDRFQAGELRTVALMIQAGGVGISLHSPNGERRTTVISPSYSGHEIAQALGRCRRIGGGRVVQHVLFPDTLVGRRMASLVRSKLHALEELTGTDFVGCL